MTAGHVFFAYLQVPATDKLVPITKAMVTSENPLLQKKEEQEPTLFCTAWKRPRFYLFTREEPE